MRARTMFLTALPLLVLVPVLVLADGDSALKIRLRPPRDRVSAGDSTEVKVEVRNKSRNPVSETLELFLAGGTSPVASAPIELGPRAATWFEFDIDLTGVAAGEKVALVARAGEAASRAWVRTERVRPPHDDDDDGDDDGDGDGDDDGGAPPPSSDDETWLAGRDLYTLSCAACHGDTGSRIRRESLSEWIEVVAKGEDDEDEYMPAFPSLTAEDVAAMRLYVNDPDRVVEGEPPPPPPPPGSSAPTYDASVEPILAARCTACHNGNFSAGGIALHTYAAAYANRLALVDSVEKNRMPSSPLSATDKTTLRDWLDAGAPQN